MARKHTALVAGASGLVGGECLARLLASDAYDRVIVLTRRDLGERARRPKLRQLVADFSRLDELREELARRPRLLRARNDDPQGGIAGEVPRGGPRLPAQARGGRARAGREAFLDRERARREPLVAVLLLARERRGRGGPAGHGLAQPRDLPALGDRRRARGVAPARAPERAPARPGARDVAAGRGFRHRRGDGGGGAWNRRRA